MTFIPAIDLRRPSNDIDNPGAPANIEAEQALLGAIMYDNAAFERVGDHLRPEHFFDPVHGRLFEMIQADNRKGHLAEPVLLAERFSRDPSFEELGGVRYLADLVDRAPPAANAPDYVREVYDLALRRGLIEICGDISAAAAAPDPDVDGAALVEQAEQRLYAIIERRNTRGFRSFSDHLTRAVENAAAAFQRDGGLAGLSTGLMDLDRKLGGLMPSDLIIAAARPSMGKSALALNIGFSVARDYAWEQQPDGARKTVRGGVVAVFSLEMSGDQLAMRLLAEVSGVPSDRIRRGDIDATDFGRIRDAALEIQDAPLHIDDTGGLGIAQLVTRARRLKRSVGLDLIIVDYLQLLSVENTRRSDNRVQDVSQITGALKALAKELEVPVLALSQLSRKVEDRDDKKPMLQDLRESGSIEQDADVVMFIYRESYYLSRTEPKEGSAEHVTWREQMDQCQGQADIIIGKQRHGPIGTVRLSFNEDITKFGNLARDGRYSSSGGAEAPQARLAYPDEA